MEIKKILVALDGGDQAEKALEAAIEIAKSGGAEIHLASAYALPIVYTSTLSMEGIYPDNSTVVETMYKIAHAQFEEILAAAAALVSSQNIPVFTEILEGSPGHMIIQRAEEKGVDLIAVGSHNRTAVDRFFMGSVSNYVVQHAPKLVLVAKENVK
jgi:nucleotide-binding universal stress UspA family protein